MTTSYYDRLKFAFEKFAEQKLPASAQLVYLHILHEENCHGRTGQVRIADTSIVERTGLSKSTVTETKRRLKNLGLLDFRTEKKGSHVGTQYLLPNLEGRVEGRAEGRAETRVETRADVNINTTPLSSKEREKERKEEEDAPARLKTGDKAEISTAVFNAWLMANSTQPYGRDLARLKEFEAKYGEKAVAAAIYACQDGLKSGDRVCTNFIARELQKGGEKRDRKPFGSRIDAWDARQDELPPE